ncbi:MAG: ribosome recycling factor [Deltaproteobacteria bacterium]|nr:MAG: ribosome recycling factor [Deltaproteobacteria bacterium]
MHNTYICQLEEEMGNVIELLKSQLRKLQSGRSNIHIFDSIRVDYFGEKVPLDQISVLSSLGLRCFTIKPWDKSLIKSIEKAILSSNLGLVPLIQGDSVNINIPEPTEEKRRDLLKQVQTFLEESKVSIRNIRRSLNEDVKKMITEEDEEKRLLKVIQEKTDTKINELILISKNKEKEIMTL